MSERLDETAIASFVDGSEWSLKEAGGAKLIHRDHKSKTARGAIERMAKIAEAAEALNHHPELTWVYNTLHIDLTTHDEGGLTDLDLQLAKTIDGILGESGAE